MNTAIHKLIYSFFEFFYFKKNPALSEGSLLPSPHDNMQGKVLQLRGRIFS